LVSVALALVQVFAPAWANNRWIAEIKTPGRAAGNLRQPNQLGSLLLLSLVALVGLGVLRGWQNHAMLFATAALLGAGVALTGSRSAAISLPLVLWISFDRGLPRTARMLPAAAIVGWIAAAALMWLGQQLGWAVFFLEARGQTGSDISSSRFGVWANTWELIRQHPWFGVGWGNFNFAWTLTPFASRPAAFFDHTHNLLLQLLVELGVPLALTIAGIIIWVVWQARGALRAEDGRQRTIAQCAFAMLLLLTLHSLLEYPLWYSYFLLPAAYLLGVFVRSGTTDRAPASADQPRALNTMLQAGAVALVFGSLYAAWDYSRVLQIYAPFGQGLRQSLEQRVENGRRSVLFGHYADFGAITSAQQPDRVFDAFRRPLHFLIETRVMIAYAQALHARGEIDKARYVAQRLREFRPSTAEGLAFFAPCDAKPPAEPLPFQCDRTPVALGYRDFL
jgi:O-antigen ligase